MRLTSFVVKGIEGDTFFPDYALGKYRIIHREEEGTGGDLFRILERKSNTSDAPDAPDSSFVFYGIPGFTI